MTKKIKYIAIISLFLLIITSCRASQVLLPEIYNGDTNWLKKESTHYFIYYRPGSLASHDINDKISKTLDSCFEDVLNQLEVDFSDKISYYIYNSSEELEIWAGWQHWGFFVGEFEYAVGVYNSTHNTMNSHETVHIVAYHTIGIAKLFFLNEGLAHEITLNHQRWSNQKLILHKHCKILLYENKLFLLDELADNSRFKEIYLSPRVQDYYVESGSFVKYLIDQYGLAEFKYFLSKAGEDNYKQLFRKIYSKSIEDFEQEWKHFLSAY